MKVPALALTATLAAVVFIGCDKPAATPTPAPTAPDAKAAAPAAAATPAVAAKPYPLDVCIVAGEKLGSMGAPVVYVHEGQEVKFCCKGCLPDFKKEPAKFLTKLAAKK
jgi:YHS domain-containing protein